MKQIFSCIKNIFGKIKSRLSGIELPKIKIPVEVVGILAVLLLMNLAFFPSFDIAPRDKLTSARFISLCEKAGYTVVDVTGDDRPYFYLEVLSDDEEEGVSIEQYVFSHRAYAKALYTHFLSTLQTYSFDEDYKYTATYNRFYKETEEGVVLLYRNEDKIIMLSGDPAHADSIDELIRKMKL